MVRWLVTCATEVGGYRWSLQPRQTLSRPPRRGWVSAPLPVPLTSACPFPRQRAGEGLAQASPLSDGVGRQ